MELTRNVVTEATDLAEQYLDGEISLPASLCGVFWLALPEDKTVLAHGAITIVRNQEHFEFKIGT